MMGISWVVLFVALTGSHFGNGLPVGSTSQSYPLNDKGPLVFEGWDSGLYAVPALLLTLTAVGLLFGCTWCYRHKDCKPNEGADNQLFAASATHLHDVRISHPPDSGFSEPVNNNISEDNNNGPISLREMQNIANNNAAAYIVSENEERNRVSRESVVEFEPLPTALGVADPLEHCADWFGDDDFPRHNLQYLREIGRGWFGRVVEGEIEQGSSTSSVAVKILNQNASLEDKARFLDESRIYRDVRHENLLAFIAKCVSEEPWILIYELCSMDLQQYLVSNRPKMAILNESGVPLRLMCDVTSALAHLHSLGLLYGDLWSGSVLVRGSDESARAALGRYSLAQPDYDCLPPGGSAGVYNATTEVWSLGSLIWVICAWGAAPPNGIAPAAPELPCPYRSHLYQVIQLCWQRTPSCRPTSTQVHALLQHLANSRRASNEQDFEDRWQRLKPNTIPVLDEHVAIVHAPSTSSQSTSNFTEHDPSHDSLSVDMDTAVSRSSSIMSDNVLSQIKSESLTNLHGSLEDVRNIYLTHNEMAVLECHQGNIGFEEREKEHDRSDSSVDPWLKDIIAGSQDDVSYYKDVSDVIKNLDNILNSEKTSSSESSHQASPSRDNLSLDCKKDYPMQSSMVKSPGITNFQNILAAGFDSNYDSEAGEDDLDRDTIGTLSHSFERHSDTTSQQTLENITPITPNKDFDTFCNIESRGETMTPEVVCEHTFVQNNTELPKEEIVISDSKIPKLKELCVASIPSLSDNEQLHAKEDCETPCDIVEDERTDKEIEAKSVDDIEQTNACITHVDVIEPALIQSEEQITVEIGENSVTAETSEPHLQVEGEDIKFIPNSVEVRTPGLIPIEITELKHEKSHEQVENATEDNKNVTNDLIVVEVTAYDQQSKIQEAVLDSDKPKLFEKDLISTTTPKPEQVQNIYSEPLVEEIEEKERTNIQIESSQNVWTIDKNTEIAQSAIIRPVIDQDIVKNTEIDHNVEKQTEVEKAVKQDIEVDKADARNTIEPTERKNDEFLNEPVSIEHNVAQNNQIIQQVVHNAEVDVLYEQAFPENAEQNKQVQETAVKSEDAEQFSIKNDFIETSIVSPETVQNIDVDNIENTILESHEGKDTTRSDLSEQKEERLSDSTVYMDLINNTNKEDVRNSVDSNIKEALQSFTPLPVEDCTLIKNDSTVYLDLPSMIKETDNFLQSERMASRQKDEFKDVVVSSTPKGSDRSEDTLEGSVKNNETQVTEVLSETKILQCAPGVSVTKLEQKYVPDSLSPFDSPTKSHHTDTYDENSSVVLGPFENCTIELFKGIKSIDIVDLPREELLAFSSNFSEMNLETPSPLRDVNFLNEVPDIIHDEVQFDGLDSISEPRRDLPTDDTDSAQSATEKHVSPSTPPNSPGNFLASTSQRKYVVDIDLNPPEPIEEDVQKEIELNQIELQITTKLAMAENENNLNIEYSGPLTVVGVVSEDSMILHDSDAMPESFLAGNGGSVEDLRGNLTLDEECVKALRNELELKLPLAQVASIEPQVESCSEESDISIPLPPPALVLGYLGALSPIAEETGQQLSAYEDDAHWNASIRTDSSESYPEPCNNSTDEVTSLPWVAPGLEPATYTVHSSPNHTYTLHAETTSKEITMSADSLNVSPKKQAEDSPIDDRTYTKQDDDKSKLERLSQVSPLLLSPTTDTSGPEDTGTAVSTLSRTTVPTDAKSSKPSETQCLSKATSIDSWCSNDTLYNVEENFDDLAMDPDGPLDFETENQDSESTDTLTHNDDKELSHCSTYIVNDSKSEAGTFSPDSITANDNNTYTKAKTEATGPTPSVITKSEVDSTKTKDLANETLMSGLPSYSNCTTEMLSGVDDIWKLPQPELVRRSPIGDIHLTPPKTVEETTCLEDSPQLTSEPSIKKMDSVEITCLLENLVDSQNKSEDSGNQGILVDVNDSPNSNYRNMAPSVTSTPLTEPGVSEDVEAIPMTLPTLATTPEMTENVPNFQMFLQSAEIRPQDISSNASNEYLSNQETEVLLEGDSKTLSRNSNRDSVAQAERTPTYSDFESSVASKPQDVNSRDKSSLSLESGVSSEDFHQFESSVRNRPQDLSNVIDASSLLLKSERRSSELAAGSSINVALDQSSQDGSRTNVHQLPLEVSPPNHTNLTNAYDVEVPVSNFLINLDDDENEQPHSIIITQSPKEISKESAIETTKESPNRTFDSHVGVLLSEFNNTYDSHQSRTPKVDSNGKEFQSDNDKSPGNCNGISEDKNLPETSDSKTTNHEGVTPEQPEVKDNTQPTQQNFSKTELSNELLDLLQPVTSNAHSDSHKINGSQIEESTDDVKCNGGSEKYATVQFLNETFEELVESNVDDEKDNIVNDVQRTSEEVLSPTKENSLSEENGEVKENGINENGMEDREVASVTENFLQNEKNYCELDSYLPLLSDIRFTGPAEEIMSTSFQESPTEPEQRPPNDMLKDWDSDSDSHSTNSSSGEFIWKDGDGHETPVVPTSHFDHRSGNGSAPLSRSSSSAAGSRSGSGSEGDEIEFVPSSWDCLAAPAKSALRSLEATPENKKRVVFKRQKYHCVYEYPREPADLEREPAYLPDLSTYTEWDPTSAEEAELGYGQLFGASTLDMYPLRAAVAFGADYDEDFFISSSARPFESLGVLSTSSQFFPGGVGLKPALPAPPSPLHTPTLIHTRTPSLDFTTPDSGVEDITPGSTSTDEDITKKLPETDLQCWRAMDSGSSSESVSPSSPAGEALGGLRHTRDKLKLDLPPSPHLPSPRHTRVFNFVLDKPKRHRAEERNDNATPLVMTDDTPVVGTSLPLQGHDGPPPPEPTFSTFGKCAQKTEPEQKIILTDEERESPVEDEPKVESPKVVEAVKGEGTVLDSGDEDSGIESSSKATLERKTSPNVS